MDIIVPIHVIMYFKKTKMDYNVDKYMLEDMRLKQLAKENKCDN